MLSRLRPRFVDTLDAIPDTTGSTPDRNSSKTPGRMRSTSTSVLVSLGPGLRTRLSVAARPPGAKVAFVVPATAGDLVTLAGAPAMLRFEAVGRAGRARASPCRILTPMSSGVDPADQANRWTSSRTVSSVVRLAMCFQRIIPFLLIISCGDDNKDAEPTTSPTGITSVSQSDPMMPSTGDGPIGTTGTSAGETGGDPSASGNSTTPTSGGTTGAPVECTDPEGQGMNSPCTDASGCGCASGHCALVPGFGGWCGECTEDADCPDAGGCRLADPFSKLGSKCDPGIYRVPAARPTTLAITRKPRCVRRSTNSRADSS